MYKRVSLFSLLEKDRKSVNSNLIFVSSVVFTVKGTPVNNKELSLPSHKSLDLTGTHCNWTTTR